MRLFLIFIMTFFIMPVVAKAQNTTKPTPPPSLAKMVSQGAQIFYLGEYEGMNGWALVRKGKPEIFYENKDRTAVIMGLMFNKDGEMITTAQLSDLRRRVGDDMYSATGSLINQDAFETTNDVNSVAIETTAERPQETQPPLNRPLTAAEKMYLDLVASNWITMNPEGKYDVFGFIDPDCPHCKTFINDVQNHEGAEGIRVRVIPVGLNESSLKKASILLASGDPEIRLKQYAAGDENALSAPENINTEGAEKNLALMGKYGFDATPLIVYKTGKGEIRMIRGRPGSYEAIINDIIQN